MMLIGIPFVMRGEMKPAALIDTWAKLSFNVNFALRQLIEQIPRTRRILEPLGRICDLLEAKPAIEPTGLAEVRRQKR